MHQVRLRLRSMRARHHRAAVGVHAGNAATQQTRTEQSTHQRRRWTSRARRSQQGPPRRRQGPPRRRHRCRSRRHHRCRCRSRRRWVRRQLQQRERLTRQQPRGRQHAAGMLLGASRLTRVCWRWRSYSSCRASIALTCPRQHCPDECNGGAFGRKFRTPARVNYARAERRRDRLGIAARSDGNAALRPESTMRANHARAEHKRDLSDRLGIAIIAIRIYSREPTGRIRVRLA